MSEAVQRPGLILAAYRHFHNYSLGNQLLALHQCEQRGLKPGPIATYQRWRERGRQVIKGARAIVLCMPVTFKRRDEWAPDKERVACAGFIYKPNWFVLSQTEGEDLPPVESPGWDRSRALATLGVEEIAFDVANGNVQGFARRRQIAISPLAALPHKTTFHELAHVLLGHTAEGATADGDETPRNLVEVEAEAVALILCETLELAGADYARGYIQSWLGGEAIPERSAQRIFRTADMILKAGAPPKAEEEEARA